MTASRPDPRRASDHWARSQPTASSRPTNGLCSRRASAGGSGGSDVAVDPDRSGVVRVNGLEQPAGLSRGGHVQLRAEAASEIVEGQARCGGLSRGDQTANQLAVRVLSKRIELDAAA